MRRGKIKKKKSAAARTRKVFFVLLASPCIRSSLSSPLLSLSPPHTGPLVARTAPGSAPPPPCARQDACRRRGRRSFMSDPKRGGFVLYGRAALESETEGRVSAVAFRCCSGVV